MLAQLLLRSSIRKANVTLRLGCRERQALVTVFIVTNETIFRLIVI
jgi:hypothetical protein